MATQNNVPKLYRTVVEDVVNGVREAFLDEGVDEQVLQELKQLWEAKLAQSKAVEGIPAEQDQVVKALTQHQTALQQQQQQTTQQQVQQPTQQQQPQQQPAQIATGPVPIYNPVTGSFELNVSGPAAAAVGALPAGLFQQQLPTIPQGAAYITIAPDGTQRLLYPTAAGVLQQGGTVTVAAAPQVAAAQATTDGNQVQTQGATGIIQLDGNNDSSSEDDDEYDKDDDDDEEENDQNEEDGEEQGEEEEPLNSDDDVSDEDPADLFDTDNVVVCQYDKITRSKNRWKFHLKDGIMNLNGKDYVFQKANGDAEW